MGCKNVKYSGKKNTSKVATAQLEEQRFCQPSLRCDIPRDASGAFDPEGIIPECIFVEKVHDAVVVEETFPYGATVNTGIVAPPGAVIQAIAVVDCKPIRNPQAANRLIVDPVSTITGAVLGNTIIGPGGLEQVEIFFPDDPEQLPEPPAEPRGRVVTGRQLTTITGAIEVTYQVQFAVGGVVQAPITQTVAVPVPQPAVVTSSFQLCLPPTGASQFLPQFAEFCGVVCEAFLATGTLGDATVVAGTVRIDTDVFLCIRCEKKIKAPAQLCVLTSGPCVPEEELPFFDCPEFPLFPIQIDRKSVV